MRYFLTGSLVVLLGFIWFVPTPSYAQYVDLSISASTIRFSEETLYAGESVRIYATIRNHGDTDSVAQVFFYKSDTLIGKSQPVSVLANGGSDDVFVDYKLPEGSFNIRAVIQGADPVDSNFANNEAVTPLFKTIADDDRDGILNEDDNCLDDANADQADLDHDHKGDVCDNDIDGDGVANTADDYPADASKSQTVITPPSVVKEETKVAPAVEVEVAREVATEVDVVAKPEPVVEGVQDEQPAAPVEAEVVAFDLSGLGNGAPVSSPDARFTFKQLDWRTYEFLAIPPLGGDSYSVAWDFGDGATSVQSTITHAFPSSGVYTVKLAMLLPDDVVITDSQVLGVSFFHLSNPMLLATLGVLLIIIIGLVILIVRLRRGEEL